MASKNKQDKTHALHEARTAVSQGDKLIGAFVYWNELAKVHMARPLFRQGFTACGLDKALQRDPLAETTLNHAATRASKQHEDSPAYVELKHKLDDLVEYAVMMRRDVGTRRAYVEEATIGLDRRPQEPTPTVTVLPGVQVDDARDALIASVVDNYADMRGYVDTQEFSQTMVRAMTLLGGVSLRTGVYYVPSANIDQAKALSAFVETNTSAVVSTWEIKSTEGNARTAQRDVKASFTRRVNELLAEVDEFIASTSVDDVQMKQVNAKMRRFADLEGKLGLFADVLADHATNLQNALDAAKKTLSVKYLGGAASPVDDLTEAA